MPHFRRLGRSSLRPARRSEPSPDIERLTIETILGATHLADGTPIIPALRALPPMAWADVERSIRRIIAFPWNRDERPWTEITPATLLETCLKEGWDLTRLGMYSLHPNGYVREAAIRMLAGERDGAELPFLLLRLNDHVPAIRHAATEAIRERIIPDYCAHWLAAIPMIDWLKEKRRSDHRWLAIRIHAMLHLPECRLALLRGLASSDPLIHRSAFHILADSDPTNIEHLAAGLDDADLMIRRYAVARLSAIPDDDRFVEMVRLALLDPMSDIRSSAAAMLGRRLPEMAGEILQDSLFDVAPMMRGIARFHLKRRGDVDIPAIYRAEVAKRDELTLAGALAGLGEIGGREDVPTADALREHRRSRIRQLATHVYLHLADAVGPDKLLRVLVDPTPRVSREALLAPERQLVGITTEQLAAHYAAAAALHVRRNIALFARRFSKWKHIIFLIDALSSTQPASADLEMLGEEIERWHNQYNRRQTTPTTRDGEEMRRALARNGALLPRSQRADLEFIARTIS